MEQVIAKKLEAFLNEVVDLTYSHYPEDKVEFEWEQVSQLNNRVYVTIKIDEDALEGND